MWQPAGNFILVKFFRKKRQNLVDDAEAPTVRDFDPRFRELGQETQQEQTKTLRSTFQKV
jgi:hypothetical protein